MNLKELYEQIGRLRPWEITHLNEKVLLLKEEELSPIFEVISRKISEMPDARRDADIEEIFLIAFDVSGIFKNHPFRTKFYEVDNSSLNWKLLCYALRGHSFEELISKFDELKLEKLNE